MHDFVKDVFTGMVTFGGHRSIDPRRSPAGILLWFMGSLVLNVALDTMDYFSDDGKTLQPQLRPKHINALRADIAAALSAFDRAADWAVS